MENLELLSLEELQTTVENLRIRLLDLSRRIETAKLGESGLLAKQAQEVNERLREFEAEQKRREG